MGAVRGFTSKVAASAKKLPKKAVTAVKARLMMRQLTKLGLHKDYVDGLSEAEREAVAEALNRWNTTDSGTSQGVIHIIDYAKGGGGAAKDKRLNSLEQYHGAGPFDIKDGRLIAEVTDALRVIIHQQGTVKKDLGAKTIYWAPRAGVSLPPSNSAKGTIIITYNKDFATFFEGNYGSYKKKK
jgi:hypothetical protein